jgi:hypothetical protein
MPIPGEPDALNGACPVRREAWGDGLLEYRALCLLYSIITLQRTGGQRWCAAQWSGQKSVSN